MGRARNVGVWTQRIAIAAVVAVLVGVAVRVGSTSSQALEFRDPLIWLVSNATGQVVQADAGSGDVTAQVEVGSAGDSLAVVQHGADALVLNRTTGQVSRVNGSLLTVAESTPVQVDATAELLGRGDAARIVTDSAVIPVDPSNAELGPALQMPKLSSAVLDGSGTLWGLDPERRVLAVSDDVAEVRVPTETRPFAIVDAGGSAQLLDGSGPTLRALESGSGLGGGSCVGGEVGPGVVVGGSVEGPSQIAVMVDSAAGIVRTSDLVTGRCTSAALDNVAGARFGPSVESGGLAFLPVLSTGEVIVVRVAEGTVINRFLVTGAEQPFELTVKDGTVWFNEPDGARAGVLGQDGVLERVDKYRQIEVSASSGSGQPGDGQPADGTNTDGTSGELAGSDAEPGDGNPGSQAASGDSSAGGDTQSVASNGGATGPVEDAPLSGLVADFTYSKRVVEVGEEVQFSDRSQGGPVAWTWEFGDGSFSTGPEAEHAWDAVGAYRVTLRIESETGTAAASVTIEVIDENTRGRPSADFRYSASRVEVGETVTFTDRSTGNATDLNWDFGDGSVATGPTAEHSWESAGTYRVALTATNALGSDTSESATITVYDRVEQPTAVIEASASQASVNQTVSFTSLSTGNPTELEWTFDDGTSARGETVSHAWTEPGTYDVRLVVSNSAGSSEATAQVVVDERVVAPIARIVASTTTAEQNQSVRFTSLSINNPTRLVWDFGDGSTDSGSSVTHSFARADRYTVTLRASNAAGEGVATITIVVIADIPAPVAAFSLAPESPVTVGVPVQFTDQSTGGAPSSWAWDFDDGGRSTQRNPTHVFTEEGTYTVRLNVENSGGRDDVTRQVQVLPPKPAADFTFSPTTPNAGVQVQFTDTSRNVTAGTTWSWNFGDGTPTSSERSPRHTFNARDTYDVTLTVTNSGGTSSVTKPIAVNPRPPVANFTYSPSSSINTTTNVQFTFRQVNGSGDPETYLWTFGDGTAPSTERNPSHVFARTGDITVTLVVSNAGGTSPPFTQTIRVTVPPATASFTVPPTPRIAGTPVAFNNTTPTQPGLSYAWEFGAAGATSTMRNPTYTYANPGTYTVTLRVTNDGGTSQPFRMDVRIYPAPAAAFTAPATANSGQSVQFDNTSTGTDAATYLWDFGDGTTSTQAEPSKTFSHVGPDARDFVVRLTVRNPGGAESMTTRTLTIAPLAPVADFTYTGDGEGNVTFTYRATAGAGVPSSYSWDFGDGSPDEPGASVTHDFGADEDGTFEVTLTVTNVRDSDTRTITISLADPTVSFSHGVVRADQAATFTNTSTGGPFSSVTWSWDDGSANSSGQSVPHTFDSIGTYTVTLTVTNARGTFTHSETVLVIP
jgi:PKD repeat protein